LRRDNGYLIAIAVFVSILAACGVFVYKSAFFEREAPKVYLPQTIFWNFKAPLRVVVSDNVGIKSCKVTVDEPSRQMVLFNGTFEKGQKLLDLNLTYPKNGFLPTSDKAVVRVEVKDGSWWNFFGGNKALAESKVVADNKPPQLELISNSYSIARGGSALVIFAASDENLDKVFVKTSDNTLFRAQPFVKTGYYSTLVAWDVKNENFSAEVVATDKSQNVSKVPVKFFIKNIVYKDTKIELKDNFLDGKILELSQGMQDIATAKPIDRFVYVNSKLRAKNEAVIEKVTSRIGKDVIEGYFAEPFLPIVKASVVGSFGDHRNFFFNGEKVSESYHMGIDFASVKEAPVLAPNDGIVIFTGENGIYGNLVILYHNLGFFTLYGHCSSFTVKEGQKVSRGDIIAKTGMSGLALGDHLHYGTVVQGVEVRPLEWLDKKWIELNIVKVMEEAKKTIAGRSK